MGYLLAVNLQIYLRTSSLKRADNVPKLPGVHYVAKNWALAMMLKALPLVHFWNVLLLKEQINDDLCYKNVKNAGLISAKPIDSWRNLPQNQPLFTDCFLVKFTPKTPENSREIVRFFHEFVPKNPAKFDFFFRDLSEALIITFISLDFTKRNPFFAVNWDIHIRSEKLRSLVELN